MAQYGKSSNTLTPGAHYSETTDTLPKADYYRSLRPSDMQYGTLTSTSGTLSRNTKEAPPVFKPSGKEIEVEVGMLDGNVDKISIDREAFGQQLFDKVCDNLKLVERDFFGIVFRDQAKVWFWLLNDKKILKQMGKFRLYFEFRVKYYPNDVETLQDDLTRYFLCLQVRQDLLDGSLRATFLTYVILGAYVVQSEAGDHDPGRHIGIEYIRNHQFAPEDKMPQMPDIYERIAELHRLHRGQSPEEADMNFLLNARKLALYGVDFHKTQAVAVHHHESSGADVDLGVYYGGVLIYREALRIKRYSWARLIKINVRKREFQLVVRPIENEGSQEKLLVFKCRTPELAQRLYQACVDHHRFFRLREQQAPKKAKLAGYISKTYITAMNKAQNDNDTGTNSGSQRTQGPTVKRANTLIGAKPVEVKGAVPPVARPEGEEKNKTPVAVAKPKQRPTFPHDRWALYLPDASSGIGVDDQGVDVAAQPGLGWQGIRSNKGLLGAGNFYYEASVLEPGPVMIGWSTNQANMEPVGSDSQGWAVGIMPGAEKNRQCTLLNNNKESVLPQIHLETDDVMGCLLHAKPNGEVTLQWTVNGHPVLPQGAPLKVPDQMRGQPLFPTTSVLDSRVLVNFGDNGPFAFPPDVSKLHPDGKAAAPYTPLCQATPDCVVPNSLEGWRMNPYDSTENADVSPNGKMLQSQLGKGWQGCRANKGVIGPGKYYYETTPLESAPTALARVGWSTEDGSLDLGSDKLGFGYGADKNGFGPNGQQGKKLHKAQVDNYGAPYTKDDTIGCFLDLQQGTMQWSKNGAEFGEAYRIPSDLLKTGVFFPTASLKDNTLDFNFGDRAFKYPPKDPSFIPVCYSPNNMSKFSKKRPPNRLKTTEPAQPKRRPMFPEEHWELHLPDATAGLGLDEFKLDAVSQPGGNWQAIRANKGLVGPGNYYFEATVLDDGPVMVGWATNFADVEPAGCDQEGIALGILPGDSQKSRVAALLTQGKGTAPTTTAGEHTRVNMNDVVGCLVHRQPNGDTSLQWSVNGKPVLPQNEPASLPEKMAKEPIFPVVSLLDSRAKVNFGDSPFLFPPNASQLHPTPKTATPYQGLAATPTNGWVPNAIEGWRMNPLDSTKEIDVAPNGLGLQSHMDKGWQGCRANRGVHGSGKYYYEAIPIEEGPGVLARVGWATEHGSLDLGSDKLGFGYGADNDGFGPKGDSGRKVHRADPKNYGLPFKKDDVLGCFIDLDAGQLQWAVNGKEFGEAFRLAPELLEDNAFFPTASLKDNTLTFNFGELPFNFPPKDSSFLPLAFAPPECVEFSEKNAHKKRPVAPPVVKQKPRPTFPNEKWALLLPDATLGIGLDAAGLDTASQPAAGWQGIRANRGLTGPGNFYYEAAVLEEGPVMIGWATNQASIEPVGSDEKGVALGIMPGESQKGRTCVLLNDNLQSVASNQENIVPQMKLQVDDIIGCLAHCGSDGKTSLQWTVNGRPVFPQSKPVKLPDLMRGEPLFPATSMLDSRVEVNFGDTPFRFPPSVAMLHPNGSAASPYVDLAQAPVSTWVPNAVEGWRMNPHDATKEIDVSPNGQALQSHLAKGWQGCRANKGVFGSGKYYYEATPLEEGAGVLARLGWSTEEGSLDLGSDKLGFGFGADNDGKQARKVHKADSDAYGKAFGKDDTVGCFLNLEDGTIQWAKNGEEFGKAYRIAPELLASGVFFPTASLKDNTVDFNFGEKPFKFPPKDLTFIPIAFSSPGNTQYGHKGPKRLAPSTSKKPKVRPVFHEDPWSLSIADATYGLGLDEAGLDAASKPGDGWQGIRANKGLTGDGNFYFEATVVEDGPVVIGWATNEAEIEPVGKDGKGFAIGVIPGDTQKPHSCVLYHENKIGTLSPPLMLKVDDTVGCLLHSSSKGQGSMQWTVNGQPILPQSQPVNIPDQMNGEPLFPAASMLDCRVEVNFGDSPFRFPPDVSRLHPDGRAATPYVAAARAPKECVVKNRVEGWRMNPFDATEAVDVSPNGKNLQSHTDKGWQGCRANKGISGGGKYFYEVVQLEGGPGVFARLGWSTENGSLDLGTDKLGFGYGADKDGFGINGQQGKKLHRDDINNYGEALSKGDAIGCYIDLQAGTLQWSKNGKEFGEAFRIPADLLKDGVFYPTASLKDNTLEFNFGEKNFLFPPQDPSYIALAYAHMQHTRYNARRGPDINGRPNRLLPLLTIERAEKVMPNKEDVIIIKSDNNSTVSSNVDKRTVNPMGGMSFVLKTYGFDDDEDDRGLNAAILAVTRLDPDLCVQQGSFGSSVDPGRLQATVESDI